MARGGSSWVKETWSSVVNLSAAMGVANHGEWLASEAMSFAHANGSEVTRLRMVRRSGERLGAWATPKYLMGQLPSSASCFMGGCRLWAAARVGPLPLQCLGFRPAAVLDLLRDIPTCVLISYN